MTDDQIMKLDEYWPYQVVVLADHIAKHTTSVLRKHGDLNLSQWRVLAAVAEKEGRTAAEVVAVTPMDKGIVSRATATLVEDGLLEKKHDRDDKRRSKLFLTKTGKKSYRAIRKDLMKETGSVTVSNKLNVELLKTISNLKLLSQK